MSPWEIPDESVVEELEFWQAGHYGPICKGLLKKRDGAPSAVVVKFLRGTRLRYQRNENDLKSFNRPTRSITEPFSLDLKLRTQMTVFVDLQPE